MIIGGIDSKELNSRYRKEEPLQDEISGQNKVRKKEVTETMIVSPDP